MTRTGRRLSRDAIEQRVATHAAAAAANCPSLNGKQLHPHVLRHSCAMSLLRTGRGEAAEDHHDRGARLPARVHERRTPSTEAVGRHLKQHRVLTYATSRSRT